MQKIAKIPERFMGGKIVKLLLFFKTDAVFCCFEHSFEP
jgi:hypothetical protein